MYKRILVPLENSRYDRVILEHVREIARLCGSRIVLLHVADASSPRPIDPRSKTSSANTGSICCTGNAKRGISSAMNMSMRSVGSLRM